MAGLVVVSMWAAARLELGTTHCALGPQNTRTNASWLGLLETVLVSPWTNENIDGIGENWGQSKQWPATVIPTSEPIDNGSSSYLINIILHFTKTVKIQYKCYYYLARTNGKSDLLICIYPRLNVFRVSFSFIWFL